MPTVEAHGNDHPDGALLAAVDSVSEDSLHRLSPSDRVAAAEWAWTILNSVDHLDALAPHLDADSPTSTGAFRKPTPNGDPYDAVDYLCDLREELEGPLAGVQLGVKASIAVAGMPIRDGTDSIRRSHSDVVKSLLSAGARIVAITAVGEMFSKTRNPVAPAYSPGFSSSGSAVAVATGIADSALGSDGAGSVRIPAAWCGLVGIKPTAGSVAGIPIQEDHVEVGPLTKTVADSLLLFSVMSKLSRAVNTESDASPPLDANVLIGTRVGVIRESIEGDCDSQILSAFHRATSDLETEGAVVETFDLPLWSEGPALYWSTVDLPRLLTGELVQRSRDHGAPVAEGRSSIQRKQTGNAVAALVGKLLLADDFQVQVGPAMRRRLELRSQIERALRRVDILMTPTTPNMPFALDRKQSLDPVARRALLARTIRNTVPLNLTGHPAISIPIGNGDSGLPIGLQIVGAPYSEPTLYKLAAAIERLHS